MINNYISKMILYEENYIQWNFSNR